MMIDKFQYLITTTRGDLVGTETGLSVFSRTSSGDPITTTDEPTSGSVGDHRPCLPRLGLGREVEGQHTRRLIGEVGVPRPRRCDAKEEVARPAGP